MKAFTTSLALMVASVEAANRFGACQKPEVQQDFDLNRSLGLWYEARRDKDCIYEKTKGICNTAEYSLNDDGSIRVVNDEWEDDTSEWGGGVGKATIADPSKNEGYLYVKFGTFIPKGDYKVIETDYDSYTVIYTCMGLPGVYNIEYAWILTRDVHPSDEVMQKAFNAITTKIPHYDYQTALYATPQGEAALSSGEDCNYAARPTSVHNSKDALGWFLQ